MKVLALLDDNLNYARFINQMETAGHHVYSAVDERAALDILNREEIQLVILDYDIPGVCEQFVKNIRNLVAEELIYIISLVSSKNRQLNENKSVNFADEYIPKPVEPDELLARLIVLDRYTSVLAEIHSREEYADPMRDNVTGAYSETTILELLKTEVNRSNRTRRPLTLALMSVDHDDKFENLYDQGDINKILIQVSMKILASIRSCVLFGRWGDHNFLFLLPETSRSGAAVVAERIQRNIDNLSLRISRQDKRKLSTRMAVIQSEPNKRSNSKDLLDRAMRALATISEAGGNNIIYYCGLEEN